MLTYTPTHLLTITGDKKLPQGSSCAVSNNHSPLTTHQIQAVLFDAVGTLIYPDPPVAEVYADAGRRYGSSLAADEIARRCRAAVARWQSGDADATGFDRPPTDHARERHRWQDLVAEVFDDVPDARGDLFESLWRHFARPEHWRLFDDVAETWRRLRTSYIVGVASNFDDRLHSICKHLEPLSGCPHLFWSARVGHPKPSPHFFRHVERELHLPAEAVLLVGDDWTNDYLGARNVGWQVVFLDRSGSVGRGAAISSLRELPV